MSDFLFTRDEQAVHRLGQPLKDLMPEPELVKVKEYSGSWGALAVSLGPYNGFEPYEDESYICVTIGGPVLYWRDNHFLSDPQQPTAATQAILQRWQSGIADWSEDLSGPFVIFIVNKKTGELSCYTDIMMFIPVYQYAAEKVFSLGTHVDIVAKLSEQQKQIDEVSVADFVLHGIVTYPHTIYTNLFQLAPATEHKWVLKSNKSIEQRTPYWEPLEINPYKNINEAALALRTGLNDYIERITETMTEVGQFISAGEDSRSIAGILPERLKRHAYIYVDSKNREFQLARRVSDTYGCEFNYTLRSHTHYLDILPEACKLVGSGQQYTHAHTLGLAKKSGVDKQLAVFGGYASDSLLKAMHIRRPKNSSKFPFLPDIELSSESRTIPIYSSIIKSAFLLEIDKRRQAHMSYIKSLRITSCHEWFMLWPYSMREAMPNLSVNRRLFASYEIYTGKDVVKISAVVPKNWKLNRKLFNKAVKPALEASKWVAHADGRLPYFPWYLNSFLQIPRWCSLVFNKVSKRNVNEGSWVNWEQVLNGTEWQEIVEKYSKNADRVGLLKENLNFYEILLSNNITRTQKVNLIQVLYLISEVNSDLEGKVNM